MERAEMRWAQNTCLFWAGGESVSDWDGGDQEEEKQVWGEDDELCFGYVEEVMPVISLGGTSNDNQENEFED